MQSTTGQMLGLEKNVHGLKFSLSGGSFCREYYYRIENDVVVITMYSTDQKMIVQNSIFKFESRTLPIVEARQHFKHLKTIGYTTV